MALSASYRFAAAVPVWEKGREKEKNVSLLARAVLGKDTGAVLHIAAHCRFRVLVNGRYFASGPARAAKGFYRADEYSLGDVLTEEKNTVAVIAAGYNANSYYLTNDASFLCAEIVSGNGVLFATGTHKDFTYAKGEGRIQKVQRYSFQRPFTECYRFHADYDAFFLGKDEYCPAMTEKTAEKRFIERRVAYCDNAEIYAKNIFREGALTKNEKPEEYDDRSYLAVGEKLAGYLPGELEFNAVREARKVKAAQVRFTDIPAENYALAENRFAVYDMGFDTTGYIRVRVRTEKDVRLTAVFNQKLRGEGCLDASEDACSSSVTWQLAGGREYDLVSFEPYTYRYIELDAAGGGAVVLSVSQYREAMPYSRLINLKKMPDAELDKIYRAATETFVQNATDIFMDCPSRERAGWLCDSWFTSQVERELTGKSTVENNFLENFIMADSFPGLPDGMLPMCYPADHPDGCFIPNWAMWYALEMYEHEKACHDGLCLDAKERICALAAYFEKFENADGLLQGLESWVFVEWSAANDFVQDVNYPSNMLYARFLECCGEMYGDEAFTKKAEAIRNEILRQSFDGEFFRDNAVMKDGRLSVTQNRTETCQYYAFFTGTATRQTHPVLWNKLMTEFGSVRDENDLHPDIHRANAFIGNYLRLYLMMNAGEHEKLLDDIRGFFLPMAEKTGTLWENMTDGASCDHGFASYVALVLNHIV